MGLRIRYLPDTDQTLWFGRRILISVVMEYVLPRSRTSTLLQQYFPRLCCSQGDAFPSDKARLQVVPLVRIFEHWGDGSVLAVGPTFLSCTLLLTRPISIIPETKGRSLEEMDIIFGAVSAEDRADNIARQEQGGTSRPASLFTFLHTNVGWD